MTGLPYAEENMLIFSGVARGGGSPSPHSHRSRFFHSRKITVIKYYNLSLTTRRL